MGGRGAIASVLLAVLVTAMSCGGDGEPSTAPAAGKPVVLVEGQPESAVVQAPDGSRRVVDGAPLRAVLAAALPLAAFKTLPDAGDTYGLEPPAYVVRFSGPDGDVVLQLGSATFDGEGYYARRCGDDRIHLVTRTLHAAVEQIARDGRTESGDPLVC